MYFEEEKMCNQYGLSCIEDYILYLLNSNIEGWEKIFGKSYTGFENILFEFLEREQNYSSIDFIERIQTTALKLRIVQIRSIENLKNLQTGKMYLMQITPNSVKSLWNIELWREDHYILMYKLGEGLYEYINDRPFKNGILEEHEVLNMFADRLLEIKLLSNTIEWKDSIALAEQLKESVHSQVNIPQKYDLLNAVNLRDSIGIYRVVVRRIDAFFACFDNKKCFEDYSMKLDALYLKLEYLRIRKRDCQEAILEIFARVREIDKQLTQDIKERLSVL